MGCISFEYSDGFGRQNDSDISELEREISAILESSVEEKEAVTASVAVAPRSRMRVACE